MTFGADWKKDLCFSWWNLQQTKCCFCFRKKQKSLALRMQLFPLTNKKHNVYLARIYY